MLRTSVIHEIHRNLCHCHVEKGAPKRKTYRAFDANMVARRLVDGDWAAHRVPSRSPVWDEDPKVVSAGEVIMGTCARSL
jgi:hypothetical protein